MRGAEGGKGSARLSGAGEEDAGVGEQNLREERQAGRGDQSRTPREAEGKATAGTEAGEQSPRGPSGLFWC